MMRHIELFRRQPDVARDWVVRPNELQRLCQCVRYQGTNTASVPGTMTR